MARYWLRFRKFLFHRILHADDTPHAIALGAAVAMLVAFLPLMGIQTVIAIGAAALLRANKAVCVPVVWITNPFSFVPIYGACLGVGRWVVPSSSGEPADHVLNQMQQQVGLLDPESWTTVVKGFLNLGVELWIGCTIVGVIAAMLSYVLTRWGVSAYRERRRRRILRRSLRRSTLQAEALLGRTTSL